MTNQYDIVLVNLDPTQGSEMKKTRPCVVISPDEMNANLNTIVIAPITSGGQQYPTRVKLSHDSVSGQIVIDQIRTIDRSRIIKKIGMLTPKNIQNVKSVIKEAYVD